MKQHAGKRSSYTTFQRSVNDSIHSTQNNSVTERKSPDKFLNQYSNSQHGQYARPQNLPKFLPQMPHVKKRQMTIPRFKEGVLATK